MPYYFKFTIQYFKDPIRKILHDGEFEPYGSNRNCLNTKIRDQKL